MDYSQRSPRRSGHPNLVLALEVEEVEVLVLVPCSEMTQAHPGEEAQTVEVEAMMKTLALAQI
jgi:hypothetical protein